MNLTIVGTGYVGLVTGCCLAEAGHQVTCVDNNKSKIADMQAGKSPIYELGLEESMQRSQKLGNLSFTSDLAEGVSDADAIFLALPTPPRTDGSADLSAVLSVAEALGNCLPDKYCLVINKSTVPVGTAEAVHQAILKHATAPFEVVSNPEFLREGHAMEDFTEPERVVVGVSSTKAAAVMRALYKPFTDDEHPLYMTDPRTAELTKYAANTFLVMKINYMNEIARLCELMGADVDLLRQAIGADSRIGHKFLHPGIGCGGSCFPKDVRALKHMSEQHDYDFKLLSATMQVNDQQQDVFVKKLTDHFKGAVKGKTFALWGLAFKPHTDDIREAPALAIINKLLDAGAKVVAFDPAAAEHVKAMYVDDNRVVVVDDQYEALHDADALLIATEWPEFVSADPARIGKNLKSKIVFDGRNIFQPDVMHKAGFAYYGVGRPPLAK